mgnify:CR=1 FL=1
MNRVASQNEIGCLSDGDLRAFHTGNIAVAEIRERMAAHLGGCDSCESRLDSMLDQPDLIVALIRAPDPFDFGAAESHDASLDSTKNSDRENQSVQAAQRVGWEPLPEKIGKYLVLDWLGRGAFGNVYKAKDPENDRFVAIKVPRLSTENAVEEFLKEARTALQLDHPSIVKVHDWGRQDDGSCFVVMQYIEGQSLLEESKTPVGHDRAASLIRDIAGALHRAHSRNVHHRDVKPANILIGENGKPYLTDFGLAIRDGDRWEHEGTVAGSYAYMPPEQVRGETQFIDGRSDVWSLGVVFYELLTRQRPFSGRTRSELFQEIEHREPRAPHVVDASVPEKLEQACLKCLEKKVGDRFGSAEELVNKSAINRPSLWKRAIIASMIVLFVCSVVFARSRFFSDPWEPFLDHEPVAIVRNIRNTSNLWTPMPLEERFEVKSLADISIAAFGESSGEILKLSTAIHIDGWVGYSGLVWGLHDTRPTRPNTEATCFTVVVGRAEPGVPLTIKVQQMDLIVIIGTDYVVSALKPIATAPFAEPVAEFIRLEMAIDATGDIHVAIDGEPVAFDHQPHVLWPVRSATKYGVTSVGEHAVFEHGRIRLK